MGVTTLGFQELVFKKDGRLQGGQVRKIQRLAKCGNAGRRLRQGDLEFKALLGYRASWKPT